MQSEILNSTTYKIPFNENSTDFELNKGFIDDNLHNRLVIINNEGKKIKIHSASSKFSNNEAFIFINVVYSYE